MLLKMKPRTNRLASLSSTLSSSSSSWSSRCHPSPSPSAPISAPSSASSSLYSGRSRHRQNRRFLSTETVVAQNKKFITGMPDVLKVKGRTSFSADTVNRNLRCGAWDQSCSEELDVVVIGTFEDENPAMLHERIAAFRHDTSNIVAKMREVRKHTGRADQAVSCFCEFTSTTFILLGLGKAKDVDWRKAGAQIANKAKAEPGIAAFGLSLPEGAPLGLVAEGCLLGLYRDERFSGSRKLKEKEASGVCASDPKSICFLSPLTSSSSLPVVEAHTLDADGVQHAKALSSGVIYARELVNAPANAINPTTLCESAEQLASEYGLACSIHSEEACRERFNLNAFLAVGAGSQIESKFIHLTYKHGTPKESMCFVGKGLTFDSGGYNLKTAGSMIELMKFDMGGSAAVLGAAATIAQLKPKDIEVHFCIATCENMISGQGVRPGDIVTAADGTTIEVNNTDAEGRLTLCDALYYAQTETKASTIIDVATLTGACMVALGPSIAGLWSNDDTLAAELVEEGARGGEKFWRMPLEQAYNDQLKSPYADTVNTGGRMGGAITAALFLEKFIKDPTKTAWSHLDIAGPVWQDKSGTGGLHDGGAVGFGVQTLARFACRRADAHAKN